MLFSIKCRQCNGVMLLRKEPAEVAIEIKRYYYKCGNCGLITPPQTEEELGME